MVANDAAVIVPTPVLATMAQFVTGLSALDHRFNFAPCCPEYQFTKEVVAIKEDEPAQ